MDHNDTDELMEVPDRFVVDTDKVYSTLRHHIKVTKSWFFSLNEKVWLVNEKVWLVNEKVWLVNEKVWLVNEKVWLVNEKVWLVNEKVC